MPTRRTRSSPSAPRCSLEDGTVVSGANIENASFGLTVCAERTAVFTAVFAGARSFSAIGVAGHDGLATLLPCGGCRQVLASSRPRSRSCTCTRATSWSRRSTCCCRTPRRRPCSRDRRPATTTRRARPRARGSAAASSGSPAVRTSASRRSRTRSAATTSRSSRTSRRRRGGACSAWCTRRARSSYWPTSPASSDRATRSPRRCSAPSTRASPMSTRCCSCSTRVTSPARAIASSRPACWEAGGPR